MAYQYCIIRSRLSGLVLDVSGGNTNPQAQVAMWDRHGNDNQVFYEDPSTGTIRSKLNDFCLDIEGDTLLLNPLRPLDPNQQWERNGDQIRNKVQNDRVLDIFNNDSSKGAKVGAWTFNGGANQLWDFEYVGGEAPHRSPNFFIVSELNDKVIDIKEGNPEEGTKIIMWSRNSGSAPNQLWYFDAQGYLRSALNDMVFSNSEGGKKLKTRVFSDDPRGLWRQDGNRLVNGLGEALDIIGAKHDNGTEICSYGYNGQSNQHWRIEFDVSQ